MGEIAPLIRRPVKIDPLNVYTELGVRSFYKGTFHRRRILGAEFSWQKMFWIKPGDLVLSNLMAWEQAIAVAKDIDEGCVGNHRLLTCQVAVEYALPEYLHAFLQTDGGMHQILEASPGSIARNKTLSPTLLEEIKVPLPPLHEQEEFVARLKAAELGEMRRMRKIREIQTDCDTLLAASFSRLAQGAPHLRMGDVAPLMRRLVPIQADATYTEIGVRSFFRGTFHRRTLSGAEFTWQKLFRVATCDLIFSNLMAWEQGIAVASPTDDGCVGNHRMLTCEADRSRILPNFLWFYFTTPLGFAQVVAASPGSIARNKTLSAEDLPNITVPVPSLDAQAWFVALHGKVEAVRKIQAEVTSGLAQLTPALLEAAFGSSGNYERVTAC